MYIIHLYLYHCILFYKIEYFIEYMTKYKNDCLFVLFIFMLLYSIVSHFKTLLESIESCVSCALFVWRVKLLPFVEGLESGFYLIEMRTIVISAVSWNGPCERTTKQSRVFVCVCGVAYGLRRVEFCSHTRCEMGCLINCWCCSNAAWNVCVCVCGQCEAEVG